MNTQGGSLGHAPMTRRGWLLFAAMGMIWGTPYLMIKVAVKSLEPPVIVFGRTAPAAAALLLIAHRTGALRPAMRKWPLVMAFAAIEMIGPWFLLVNAEKRLPSGLTGLLVACVPIVGTVVAFALGDRRALHPVKLGGIALGLSGVALIVGRDLRGEVPWWSVVSVLVVCVGYASAPFLSARRLSDVPSIGVIALSLAVVAVVYAPIAAVTAPSSAPPAKAVFAVLGLAVFCTGLAFVVFFELIAEVGPTRATLITFVNPAVAVLLGVAVLGEDLTAATVGGFALVLAGCWLATRQPGSEVAGGPASGPSPDELEVLHLP